MKKFLWLLLLIPFNIKAVNCDYSDIARYQALASNINFNYDYVEGDNITFNIIVTNLSDDLYIYDRTTGNTFSSRTVGSSETILYGYNPGNDYGFDIIPYDEACYEEIMLTKYVNIPYYNPYYNDQVCNGYENYKLCSKWIKMDLSYDDFVNKVNEYKKKSSKPNVKEDDIDYTNDVLNKIIVGFLDNYVIILISIIIICGVGIVILSKKGRFDLR